VKLMTLVEVHVGLPVGCVSASHVLKQPEGSFISSCIKRFRHVAFPARQILFSTFTMSEPDRSGQCWNAYATLCMTTDLVKALNNICRAGNVSCMMI
jgi:hypothetical protein